MNFRIGDTRTLWVFGILAMFILILSLSGLWKRFEAFIFIANLLGFDRGIPPAGVSIIGINLEKDTLEYLTGEKWRIIDTTASDFSFGDYTFNPATVKDRLHAFYVATPRTPNTLIIEANHWRYWEVALSPSGWGILDIQDVLKEGFEPNIDFKQIWLSLDYSNALIPRGSYDVLSFAEHLAPIVNAPLALPVAVAWRDQILEGHACETFVSLPIGLTNLNAAPGFGDTLYTVRKLDKYLFVDLDTPVLEGTPQKSNTLNCFTYTPFDPSTITPVVNPSDIEISFDETGRDTTDGLILWDYDSLSNNGGWYARINGKLVSLADPSVDEDYRLSANSQRSLWLGLQHLFNVETGFNADSDDRNIKVTIISGNVRKSVSGVYTSLSDQAYKVDRSLYAIMNAYHQFTTLVDSETK